MYQDEAELTECDGDGDGGLTGLVSCAHCCASHSQPSPQLIKSVLDTSRTCGSASDGVMLRGARGGVEVPVPGALNVE